MLAGSTHIPIKHAGLWTYVCTHIGVIHSAHWIRAHLKDPQTAQQQGFLVEDWSGNQQVDLLAKKGALSHGGNPQMERDYMSKLQMVRAVQCHMLNTWTYVQTTPEFVCYKAQRAAHRAEQKAKEVPKRPNGAKRQRTPMLSKHDIQKFGALEGCAKCGRWEVPLQSRRRS